MTAFEDLAKLPFGPLDLAIEAKPVDSSGVIVPQYLTTAPQLRTRIYDQPSNQAFHARVLTGWRIDRSVGEPGKLNAPSSVNIASLRVDDGEGRFTSWGDLRWNGTPLVIKVGGRQNPDGTAYEYRDFETVFTGIVEDVYPVAESTWEIAIFGRARALAELLSEEVYRGFGGGLRIPDTQYNLSKLSVGAEFDFRTAGLCQEWFGDVKSLPITWGSLGRLGTGYGLVVNSAGALYYLASGTAYALGSTITTGVQQVSASVTPEGSGFLVEVWLGTSGSDLVLASSTSIPAIGWTSGETWSYNGYLGGGFVHDLWELRLWNLPRTEDQIRSTADRPLTDPLGQTGLLEVWKFADAQGTTVTGEKLAVNLTVGTNHTWIATRDGDDPEHWPASPQGLTKPLVLGGSARNVRLQLVDSPRLDYELGQISDWTRVYSRGGPLFPKYSITLTAANQVQWNNATKRLISNGVHNFRRFVPSQTVPDVNGQLITIENATGYNGTYGCAAVGATTLNMKLVLSDFSGDVSLTAGFLPSGAVIRTATASEQFEFLDPYFRLLSAPDGDLTADVTGQKVLGSALMSDLFEFVAGETVDTTDLVFDPEVALVIGAGERVTRQQAMDALAFSALAYWIEDGQGGYRLATQGAPTGTPVATICKSLRDVEDENVTSIVGRIENITPVKTRTPSWRINVGFNRTWHVHDGGALITSLTPANRDRLTTVFREVSREYETVRTQWPTSETAPRIETLITKRADALTLLALAAELETVKLRWFQVQAAGIRLLQLPPGAVVWLTHDDPVLRLQTPLKGRVMSIVDDSSTSANDMQIMVAA